jgi:hypothetical protein
MGLPNLSGSNIQDTYQRVLHTNGSTLFNGTGSIVGSLNLDVKQFTANGNAQFYNPTVFSDNVDMQGNINLIGNVTASGIIKASAFVNTSDANLGLNLRGAGTEITGALDVTQDITATNITASGNISASGAIKGNQLNIATAATFASAKITGNLTVNGDITSNNSHIKVLLPITASSDISASGDIVGSNLRGTNTGDQDLGTYMISANTASFAVTSSNVLFGHITSSGNISASGTIIASSSLFNNVTITPEGSYGGILDITSGQFEKTTAKFINTFTSTNNNTFAGYFQGGNANGTPGGTEKSYGVYTLAGDTNLANPDSIALYAQSHEDGSPNSYAAIFSGSGGVVGINTLEPTEALHVVGSVNIEGSITASGNISASGTITATSFIGTVDGGYF